MIQFFEKKSRISLLRNQTMPAAIQYITNEVADNWPAFVYIALGTVFSVCFLRERRAEVKVLKQLCAALEERMGTGFNRIERLMQPSITGPDLVKGEVSQGDRSEKRVA